MCFLPLKSSHCPSRPVPVTDFLASTRPVPSRSQKPLPVRPWSYLIFVVCLSRIFLTLLSVCLFVYHVLFSFLERSVCHVLSSLSQADYGLCVMYYHHFLQRSVCHILFLHSWADRLSVTFYSSSLSSAEYLSVCLSQFYLHFLEQGVCLFVFHVYPHYLSVCLSPFILTFLIIWSPFVWLVGGCGALAALSIEHLPTLLRYESSTLILYKELSSTIF